LARFQEDYALKSSMLGKVAVERLVDQEKSNKQLSEESKELKRNFALTQSTNLDLEKKVAELAEALKICQDEKNVAGEALEKSEKELEKLQKTHEDDLSLTENLRKIHDRSAKVVEDLHANNADLARSLSSKRAARPGPGPNWPGLNWPSLHWPDLIDWQGRASPRAYLKAQARPPCIIYGPGRANSPSG
jgi:chromosome segregation ATPase